MVGDFSACRLRLAARTSPRLGCSKFESPVDDFPIWLLRVVGIDAAQTSNASSPVHETTDIRRMMACHTGEPAAAGHPGAIPVARVPPAAVGAPHHLAAADSRCAAVNFNAIMDFGFNVCSRPVGKTPPFDAAF